MRFRIFLLIIAVSLFALPVMGEDEIDSSSGPVRVSPKSDQSVSEIPVDEETGMVDWYEYLSLPAGVGAKFGYSAVLYPPDPAALVNIPEILLDGAWLPPIPFAYGFSPPADGQIATNGWWMLEDSTGLLARRDMEIVTNDGQWIAATWFLGGSKALHIEEGWKQGYLTDSSYLPDEWTGPGIDYFLKSVWFRGILEGERMETLLQICGAVQIGRDMIAGTRKSLLIYQVPGNELDRQNGRGSLLVWVSLGDWKIAKSRLHTVYATEVIEYKNISSEIQNDPQSYYSEYLPWDAAVSIDQYLLTHETPFWSVPYEEISNVPMDYHTESGTGFADLGSMIQDEEVEGDDESE